MTYTLQMTELKKGGIDTDILLTEGESAFFVWEWQWMDNEAESGDDGSESETDITVVPETDPEEESEAEEDGASCDPPVFHTITFKCIGCTRDTKYQQTLEAINELRHAGTNLEDISCRIMPEPENPQDAKAITFQCFLSNDWQTIGYVVREALDEVHLAISNHKIASVRLKWVKYIIYWKTPAWYAGIDIVRVGEWPRHVLLSQSAKL